MCAHVIEWPCTVQTVVPRCTFIYMYNPCVTARFFCPCPVIDVGVSTAEEYAFWARWCEALKWSHPLPGLATLSHCSITHHENWHDVQIRNGKLCGNTIIWGYTPDCKLKILSGDKRPIVIIKLLCSCMLYMLPGLAGIMLPLQHHAMSGWWHTLTAAYSQSHSKYFTHLDCALLANISVHNLSWNPQNTHLAVVDHCLSVYLCPARYTFMLQHV